MTAAARALLLSIVILASLSCGKGRKPGRPAPGSVTLAYAFDDGAPAGYRVYCAIDAPVAGMGGTLRSMSILWTQTAKKVEGGTAATVESRVDDFVVETDAGAGAPGLSSVVHGALVGKVFTATVSRQGDVAQGGGGETDWKEAFKEYFAGHPTAPARQEFLERMAALNFSAAPVQALLALPFRALPGVPAESGASWSETRALPVAGVMVTAETVLTVEGIEELDGKDCLVIASSSSSLAGSATVDLPAQEVPLVMDVTVAGGTLEGRVWFDAAARRIVKSDETLRLTVDMRAGLPSLDPAQGVAKDAQAVRFDLVATIALELQR